MRAVSVLVAVLLCTAGVAHAVVPSVQPARDDPAATPSTDRPSTNAHSAAPLVHVQSSSPPDGGVSVSETERLPPGNDSVGPNVSRVLTLPEGAVDVREITTVRLDAAGATAGAVESVSTRLETAALRARLNQTNDTEARAALIRRATQNLSERTAALRERQSRAIAAYNSGEIGAESFLVRLARIDETATLLGDRVDVLSTAARTTLNGSDPVVRNLTRLRYELRTFDGPVRERVGAAVAGETDTAPRVFVATTDRGVTLTTLVNHTYVREVYRGFLWESGGTGVSGSDVVNVTARGYPEIWSARQETTGVGSNASFVFTVTHPGGLLEAHIRGDNRRVFREIQRLSLSNYPLGPGKTRQLTGLRMRVNRTYPGGPLRIAVVDAETGNPVNTTVSITPIGSVDNRPIGRTGSDGVLWTLSPGGSSRGYVITAIEPETSRVVVLLTEPTDPTTVGDARRRG
jgi:hypothetical protein